MKMKPNCQRCYYSGIYDPKAHLASCDCKMVAEETVTKFDPLFRKERQYVSRKEWDEERDCENFIPHLSEADGDYELEAICTFSTSFDCPFCGNKIYVYDIGIEETQIVTCDECEKEIAVQGKGI